MSQLVKKMYNYFYEKYHAPSEASVDRWFKTEYGPDAEYQKFLYYQKNHKGFLND